MHARSAVVDLYGDHLGRYGWWAPVSAVVALARESGVHPPATRTAVSRLVREGWLQAESRDAVRGYAATPLAVDRLRGAGSRIYAPGPGPWSGSWQLVVVEHGGDRRRREQTSASLSYLGYGRLAPATWISPWASPELAATLEGQGVTWTTLTGPSQVDPAVLAARVWDLDRLAEAYAGFLAGLPDPVAPDGQPGEPAEAFRVRTAVVHRWRKFLFSDPGLPAEALPPGWVGTQARERFLEVASALRPAAEAHVDETLAGLAAAYPYRRP